MRSSAPLVDDLLQDKPDSNYSVAIEETTKSRRTLAATLGIASSLLALVNLVDLFKLPK